MKDGWKEEGNERNEEGKQQGNIKSKARMFFAISLLVDETYQQGKRGGDTGKK